ncbi:MAG: leucine-rich repeat domain-containing protein [Cyclobacteriaceae bacterium]|jgi:hypothetical protein|nr:hypothetical protein [Flammeovirgaceae bacterium]
MMRVITWSILVLVGAISCKPKIAKERDAQIPEEVNQIIKAGKDNCDNVFGTEAAIRCAKVADRISAYSEEWPEGTNSTLFFQLIADNKNLREVNFCFIKIDSLPASISRVSNLEILHLTGGVINRVPDAIGDLKKLQTLVFGDSKTECYGSPIHFISPKIGNCNSLEYLGLSFSEVEDLPVELLKCKKLKTIDLFENKKIDRAKLKELKERFKGVEIITHLN